ncbi:MAG: hypothetical protein ACM3UU_02190 [Ignavibacteriales bacterium]
MRKINSKAVYNRLMKTYGNSFQSILDYHSLKTNDEGIYTQDATVRQIQERDLLDYQREAFVEETLVLAGSLCKTNDSIDCVEKESIIFFTEGYVEAEEIPFTSKRVQESIEVLAQRVTRNIINSKGVYKV